MSVYDYKVKNIVGNEVSLEEYKGKVLLIVNIASKCGFTPQYNGLEQLYKEYKDKGLEILGFPCNQFANQEPDSNEEVKQFCQMSYGVSFPLFSKIDVRDKYADDLYKYLVSQAPFKGLDTNKPSGKMLNTFLNEKFPEYLVGDSIKWNFTKFLVDKEGNVVQRYESIIEPMEIDKDIEKLL